MRLTGLPTGFENEGVWVSLPTVPDVLPSGGANGGQIRVSRDRARGPSNRKADENTPFTSSLRTGT